MKNSLTIKLILILSLISNILSYGVIMGGYLKSSFANRDPRFSNAFTLVHKKLIQTHGDSNNIELFPVAAYQQIVNGINYKMITAIRDVKNKKVNFVTSVVYTGSFTEEAEPTLTSLEKIPESYDFEIDHEAIFVKQYLERQFQNSPNSKIVTFNSMVKIPNVTNDEKLYSVNVYMDLHGKTVDRYYILSLKKEGWHTMHIYDSDI